MIHSPAGRVAAYRSRRRAKSPSSLDGRRSTPTSSSAPDDEVHVRVVEPGDNQPPAGIDDARRATSQTPHILVQNRPR